MTALIVIFSEVMPKTIAINHPERMALLSARPIAAVAAFLGPITLAVEAIVRWFLRMVGFKLEATENVLTGQEELRGAVDLLHKEGSVVREERDMFGGLLDLKDLVVSDVMIHRTNMVAIDVDSAPEQIVREVLAARYTRMPLWRDNPENIVGVIHAKDLLRELEAAGGDASKIDIASIALAPWFVPDTTNLSDQLKAFLKRKTHFALVVDEYGEVMGLVTLEDILEEIVGDIADEHDVTVSGVRPQPTAQSPSTARCRSAISTGSWTGTCPTTRRRPSPGSSFTRRSSFPKPGRSSPSTASASRCCARAGTGSRCSASRRCRGPRRKPRNRRPELFV